MIRRCDTGTGDSSSFLIYARHPRHPPRHLPCCRPRRLLLALTCAVHTTSRDTTRQSYPVQKYSHPIAYVLYVLYRKVYGMWLLDRLSLLSSAAPTGLGL